MNPWLHSPARKRQLEQERREAKNFRLVAVAVGAFLAGAWMGEVLARVFLR